MVEFTKNIEELMLILNKTKKHNVTNYIEKNFKENVHYIIQKLNKNNTKQRGGQNKIIYLLTEETFELAKNTYNLKHRYVSKLMNNDHINIIMSLENQTIGFIEKSFKKLS
jgi:phage-related tail protein